LADRSITIALEARVQGFVAGMRTAQQSATDFADRTAAFARDNEQHLDKVGKGAMIMGGAMLGGVALAVNAFMEFDKAMSEVQASTHETEANMELLREAAINAGADTAFSAKEAAQGIDELAKAGVSTADILSGGLTGALSLAAAGSLGVGEAAEIAATALTQFKLSGSDIPHIADLLAAGAGKAQGSVQDMGAALKQTGLVAASTGLSIEETTGGLAAFASAGLIGSDAGTSFKSMLQRLTPQSKEAEAKMTELGVSAYDAQGQFIGLAKFSENLKQSMSDLTPEARSAAMGVIFGSDAVRAANVLYEQGGKGIREWTSNVNDAGFAAMTAAIKQDNLAGDIEKLGGSFDSVLIKGGGGVAEALRGLVQGAEDMVDAFGKIPAPVLSAGAGIAGIGGAALLVGGSFMTLLPKIIDARASFQALSTSAPRAAGALGKVGKAAGVASVAMIAFTVFNAMALEHRTKSTEELANAILKVAKQAGAAKASDLDSVFQGWDLLMGKSTVSANGMAEAIARITKPQGSDGINRWADQAFGWTGLAKSETTEIDARLKSLGDTMGDLASGGATAEAARSFNLLSKEFEANGSSAQDALNHIPGYKDALLDLAQASGVALSDEELLDFARGKIPKSLSEAQAATEAYTSASSRAQEVNKETAEALEKIGVNAQGTVAILNSFVEVMQRAGLLTLSERDASRAYAESLMDLGLKADGTGGKIGSLGREFDNSTEKGIKNQAAFDGVARAGLSVMQAMADTTDAMGVNIYTQEDLQAKLNGTYQNLITAAGQFGITGQAADELARSVLGVPKGVSIESWMSDYAKKMAQQTTGELDKLDGRKVTTTIETINRQVNTSEYRDDPSMVGLDPSRKAIGGRVFGPGTTTSDSIPHMLSKDEYVIKASSAKAIGYDNLDRMNAGTPLTPAVSYRPVQAIASAPAGDTIIYVTNPFTGEEVRGIVRSVSTVTAQSAIASADSQSQFSRRGR
jgi:TP901 family phage tail tape measure protein